MAGCENCPLDISYDVAEGLIGNDQAMDEAARQRALGGIILNRRCLEAVYEKSECDGPVTSQNGQRVCPLQDMTYSARSIAFGQWNQANYTTPLDKLADGEKNPSGKSDGQVFGNYM
jgi:hypothetical protein